MRRCRVRLPYLTLVLSSTLTIPLFAIAAVIAVVGQIFILRDALAGRTPAASNTPAGRAREIIWIALPALTLALLLVATWRAIPPRAPVFTPTSNPGIPATPPAARMPTAGA
ncbi:MAG: hypothetical protein IT361_18720 [Gemmatimonadaceae bacterium]|nr:hypothetical protein [Gemmatimonadaceae bacterium]